MQGVDVEKRSEDARPQTQGGQSTGAGVKLPGYSGTGDLRQKKDAHKSIDAGGPTEAPSQRRAMPVYAGAHGVNEVR